MSNEDVARWDAWFSLVGGEYLDQWDTVKQVNPSDTWGKWATIIELNRISAATESAMPASPAPGVGADPEVGGAQLGISPHGGVW